MAFYAVLAAKGMLDPALLDHYGDYDNPLGYHPDRLMLPGTGVEMSSGSLGHGLPLAIGAALALRTRSITDAQLWVLVGDAELDEDSNHEAISFAGRQGLDHLHVVVIDNDSATVRWPGGVETRFAAEGWSTCRVDGRDHAALETAFTQPHPGRPHAVIAEVERKDGTPHRNL
jgi:transketolase